MTICLYCGIETEPELRYHERGDCGQAILNKFSGDQYRAIEYLGNQLGSLTNRIIGLEAALINLQKNYE